MLSLGVTSNDGGRAQLGHLFTESFVFISLQHAHRYIDVKELCFALDGLTLWSILLCSVVFQIRIPLFRTKMFTLVALCFELQNLKYLPKRKNDCVARTRGIVRKMYTIIFNITFTAQVIKAVLKTQDVVIKYIV